MKDVIAQKLGIKEEFINEKNGEYLIKGVDTAIVVNKDNSDIFKEYYLKFENCYFGEFEINNKKDIKWIELYYCNFESVKLKNVSLVGMCFIGCRVSYLLLNGCNFSKSFSFIRCYSDKKDAFSSDSERVYYSSKNQIGEITSQEIQNVVSHNTINGLFSVQVSEVIEKMNLKYTTFSGECSFAGNTFDELDLSHCVFKKNVSFLGCKFKNKSTDFSHSGFEGNADFSGGEFGAEVDVEKTIDLSSITFNGNAKFDESVFNHFVAFHTTSFKATASFYKCKFNTIPNFSPADFNGILNINNVIWGKKNKGFEYDNVEKLVEKAYNSNDTMENVINLRSSFSGMKHKLIEQDNLLDAQNFHKAELYCKEIELKKVKSRSTKEWVEWMLLLLYRKTSDHHTDLNRILHIMLMVIVSYGVMVLALEKILTCSCGVISSFLFASIWFVGAIAVLYPLYNIKEWRTGWLARGLLYAGTAAILLYQPQILNPVLGMSSSNEYKNTRVMKVIDKLTAAELNQVNTELIAWRHIQANIAKSTREQILENKNIIKKNKYLTPALPDIVTAIKQDEVIYATRQSMSVIYIVLLVLCLYSLQKTARKNTIVPS